MADDSYNVQLVLTADDRLSITVRGVKRSVDDMDDGMKKAANGAGTLENSFKRLQQAMELGIAGAMLNKVGDIASQMYELGEATRIATSTFTSLSGGTAEANDLLAQLQERTGGIISNLELMQGASKYLSMGLGQTSEEVSRLIEMATKLGGAMGNDATSSVEDFAMLLANQSLLRLDQFGISSGKVRERIEELQAAIDGLSREDAFRMAVLEQGSEALDRLGDSADAAVTPLARFQTSLENIAAVASSNFATGVNATIGLIEGVVSAANRSSPEVQAADQEAFARGVVVAERFLEGYQTALTDQNVRDITAAAFQKLRDDPGFDMSSPEAIPALIPNAMMMTDEQWQQADFLLRFIQEQNTELEHAAELNEQNLRLEEMRVRINERGREVLRQVTTFITDAARQNALDMQIAAVMDQADMAAQLMAGVAAPMGRGSVNGVTLITPDELAQIEQLGRQYEQALDAAQELHDQDLISDEQLAYIESGADEMERMRDAARDGAAALRDLSLSQIFGEGGQSQLAGDLSSSFLDAAQSLDLSAEDYQALADTIRLSTGEITDASTTYRDDVIPLLLQVAQQLGDDAAASALASVEQYLRDAAMQGLTPQQTAAGMMNATGYTTIGGMGFGGSQFTVNPGDTPSSVATRYGLTVDQVMAGAGISNPRLLQPGSYGAGGGGGGAIVPLSLFDNPAGFTGGLAGAGMSLAETAQEAVSPFQEIETSVGKVSTDLDAINSTLDEINGKQVVVKLDLDMASIPKWFRDLLEQTNRDAGGTSPGTTQRGRSQVYAG